MAGSKISYVWPGVRKNNHKAIRFYGKRTSDTVKKRGRCVNSRFHSIFSDKYKKMSTLLS